MTSAESAITFAAVNPLTRANLPPPFLEATEAECDRAMQGAAAAFEAFRSQPPGQVAQFLDTIGGELLALGNEWIERAQAETGLPEARLLGERGRTVGQLKMFADLVRDGSWVGARIDRAQPDRKPAPRPDLRRMYVPIGPVVVFGASNFPLAFSVAGGDTASALAAGNPVVVKAHPAHPGTSELAARAILSAAQSTGMPRAVFSMVHGARHEVGIRLVKHPAARAVAFTGSLKAGRALFDAAAQRDEPIPVYAEMGSTNPVFVLPGALERNADSIAGGLLQSVTLGVGQFCTNPGLVFGLDGPGFRGLIEKSGQLAAVAPPGVMLYSALCERYEQGTTKWRGTAGVRLAGESRGAAGAGHAAAKIFTTDAKSFLKVNSLHEELFGPCSLMVGCASREEMLQVARSLQGQLTATIHGTEDDLAQHAELVSILKAKAGRLIFNGFPTGVEVCPAMQHGGPYPATTAAHFTSVGTAAIERFVRPICFQNFPQAALPPELQDSNPRKIWRLVDGRHTDAQS